MFGSMKMHVVKSKDSLPYGISYSKANYTSDKFGEV